MNKKLKIAFMGGPEFSSYPMRKILEMKHNIAVVYTKPPKPAGRGKNLQEQPLSLISKELGLKVLCPENFIKESDVDEFRKLELDLAIVFSYGIILPENILNSTKYGCINIHTSILPRWRGASPVQSAILYGDQETGVSIMLMDAGLDTGPILNTSLLNISDNDNTLTVLNKLSYLASDMICDTLEGYISGKIKLIKQDSKLATYSKKISKSDLGIDFNFDAQFLERKIRSLAPKPGARCIIKNELIKVIYAKAENKNQYNNEVGRVLDNNLLVSCKKGNLRLIKIQRPGKKMMYASEVMNGWSIDKGLKLR